MTVPKLRLLEDIQKVITDAKEALANGCPVENRDTFTKAITLCVITTLEWVIGFPNETLDEAVLRQKESKD